MLLKDFHETEKMRETHALEISLSGNPRKTWAPRAPL